MNLIHKFIESEAQKAFHDYRDRFDKWLSTVDLDNNGETDKQQILADFDRIQNGALELLSGANDLLQLAAQYYDKYGKQPPDTAAKTPAPKP